MRTTTNFIFRMFSILSLFAILFGNLGTIPSAHAAANQQTAAAAANLQWTWVDGANTVNQIGVYGTEDVSDSNNVPGARYGSVTWVDASSNLWLFGGASVSNQGGGPMNDLWMFDLGSQQWTWVDGSNTPNQTGIYGAEDVPAPSNVPGARSNSVSWIDTDGYLWLFGGYGLDAAGSLGQLNDLWKFSPGSGQWTWVDGSKLKTEAGVYGTEDIPADSNVPGGRSNSVSWVDSSGSLWLFGGHDGASGVSYFNDLWKFNRATEQWTWVDGRDGVNQRGFYGTEDIPADSNVPGARVYSVSWVDSSGSLWLFGGDGFDSLGITDNLNDLWKFNPASGQWTWVDGSNTRNQIGIYGTEDVPATNNVPGARYGSVSWIDSSGKLWLFGGRGYDGAGNVGFLDDLWMFNPASGQWTWADGSNTRNQIGIYGTEDVPAADNVPGGRQESASWIDLMGNLWLFGGYGIDGNGAGGIGYLNDLWKSSDVSAPTVTSLIRTSPSPTNASSVNFAVAFSESVTGVDVADFSLTTNGVTNAFVSVVNGSDSAYIVTVNTGTGNGTIRLNLPATATITDLSGNPVSGLPFTGGETYTINRALTPASLVNSVLPTSRTPMVGSPVTIFNTVVNAGSEVAYGVTLSMNPAPNGDFDYYQTNCNNNMVISGPNPYVDIAPGGVACYLLSFTPDGTFAATLVHIQAQALNTPPSSFLPGINTWLLRATTSQGPDIIALTTTTDLHQVACNGIQAFAVAMSNVGTAATGDITVSANTGSASLPLSILIQETNPGTGAIIGDHILNTLGAGENRTVAVFVTFNGCVNFDPAVNRVFIEFRDANNNIVGSTSTAISTNL